MHSVHPMRAHHAYLYIGVRLCMYAYMHTCMYVGVYVRMYACMHAHMLVYIYIYRYVICVYALHSCAFILYALALCTCSTHSLYSLALCARSTCSLYALALHTHTLYLCALVVALCNYKLAFVPHNYIAHSYYACTVLILCMRIMHIGHVCTHACV